MGFHHLLSHAVLLVVIGEAVALVITIVQAIRRDPKDRVLWFEFLAFVTFFLGMLFVKLAGFAWPVVIVWMMLFFGFGFAAAYFAVSSWLRGTKRVH
jgi:NAD/NADP transhydrogenase beta subunit